MGSTSSHKGDDTSESGTQGNICIPAGDLLRQLDAMTAKNLIRAWMRDQPTVSRRLSDLNDALGSQAIERMNATVVRSSIHGLGRRPVTTTPAKLAKAGEITTAERGYRLSAPSEPALPPSGPTEV